MPTRIRWHASRPANAAISPQHNPLIAKYFFSPPLHTFPTDQISISTVEMFYAYDAAFTGAGAAETVGSRRRRKEREREGSISSNSSSERTGSPISHSDSKSTSSSEKDSSFGGFGFGFGFRGASKHRKKEPAHPRSLSGSIKDSRSIHTSELSVAPASPADSGVGESLAGSLERLELKADSSSDNQQEMYLAIGISIPTHSLTGMKLQSTPRPTGPYRLERCLLRRVTRRDQRPRSFPLDTTGLHRAQS